MILETLTPEILDQAIAHQCVLVFDRDHFSKMCGESKEFMEYVQMLSKQIHTAGPGSVVLPASVASAISLGIEIGVALAVTNGS